MTARETVESWWTALRLRGVPLDPEQLGAACRVADHLEGLGRGDRLLETVQGILTKNERDLRLLREIARPKRGPGRFIERGREIVRKRRWMLIAAAVGGLVLLVAGWLIVSNLQGPGGEIGPAPTPAPSPPSPVPQPPGERAGLRLDTFPRTFDFTVTEPLPAWARAVEIAIPVVPALLVVAAYLWWRWRSPAWTRLPIETIEHQLTNNLAEGGQGGAVISGPVHALVQACTAYSDEPSETLDIRRTVEATARHAGLLRPEYCPRLADSPVHLAIERHSREDHVSEFYFRIADGLRALGVEVQTSQYRQDLTSRRDEDGKPMLLRRPNPWETRAVMLVVGDGDAFFGSLGNAVLPAQARTFEHWPQRALLSTRPVILWGEREDNLRISAMAVAPASGRGLAAIAERLGSGQRLHGMIGVRERKEKRR